VNTDWGCPRSDQCGHGCRADRCWLALGDALSVVWADAAGGWGQREAEDER